MLTTFLRGHVKLLLKRCEVQRNQLEEFKKMPSNTLSEELHADIQELSDFLWNAEDKIRPFLVPPGERERILLQNQLYEYKNLIQEVEYIEKEPLALLDHYNEKDEYLYRFQRLLYQQIGYHYRTPLICGHSTGYFYAVPMYGTDVNLIHIPSCEDQFLLGIPFLIHELGHALFHKKSKTLAKFFSALFYRSLREHIRLRREYRTYKNEFDLLEASWQQCFVEEFFCDIFATYITGPAYAWAYLQLILAKIKNADLYYPGFGEEEVHPAPEARMRTILLSLELLGNSDASQEIRNQWETYKAIMQPASPAQDEDENEVGEENTNEMGEEYFYSLCYPEVLLRKLAELVIDQCGRLKLKPYYKQKRSREGVNLLRLMQEAWNEFHNHTQDYTEWETQHVRELKDRLWPRK